MAPPPPPYAEAAGDLVATFTPDGFAKHVRKWTKERRKEAKEVAFDVALRGVHEGANVSEALHIVDRRTYIQRFRAVRTKTGAELQNDAPHAATIEFGRRPGATPPPMKVILAWLKRKGIRSADLENKRVGRRKKKSGKGLTKGRKQGRTKALESLAFMIAKAIGRRGQPAHAVFRRHLRPKLTQWYREGLRKMLRTKPKT